MNDLYDTDLVLWSKAQAAALRRRAANEIDWDNVAEEIESLGKNDRRELQSRLQIVLDHLIRLAVSPASAPRHGWERTVITQRDAIAKLLRDSPSLRREMPAIIAAELPTARRLALLSLAEHGETPGVDVATLDFGEADVLGSPERETDRA
jgi:cell division protein FtsL